MSYVLHHRKCGHVAGLGNDKAQLAKVKDDFEQRGIHDFRIRRATNADLTSVANEEACDTCTVKAAPSGSAG